MDAVGGLSTHGEAGPARTEQGIRNANPWLCPHLSPAHTSLPSWAHGQDSPDRDRIHTRKQLSVVDAGVILILF